MMGPFLTALFLSVGAGTWIFLKLQQRTGYGNVRSALKGAGISAAIIFIIAYMVVRMFWS